jgi:hypothetical protein
MKQLARFASLLTLVCVSLFFANCDGGGGDDKSEQQVQFEKLKFTWTMQSVTQDGSSTGNAAAEFTGSGLTLSITGNFAENGDFNYNLDATTQVTTSPWPEAGKWRFGSPVTSQIIRLDSENSAALPNVPMGYSLSNGDKTLTVTIDNYEGSNFVVGRTQSVSGDWVFVFTRP